jgi:hypothetical protein
MRVQAPPGAEPGRSALSAWRSRLAREGADGLAHGADDLAGIGRGGPAAEGQRQTLKRTGSALRWSG